MKSKPISNVTLSFDSTEQDTADQISKACVKATQLIQEIWGLDVPEGCHIYLMTSGLSFVFQSAPWYWRILLGVTMPFWYLRVRRTWPYSAAWTQRYGGKVAIGVKPPKLLEKSDKSISIHMFVEEKDTETKVQHIICHELVHACSAHMKLSMWLNEGLATVTVDRFLEKQTIHEKTLELIKDFLPKETPPTYRELSHMSGEIFAYHAVRGYWVVRYLEEKCPGFLRRMFSLSRDSIAIGREMASELGMKPETFWSEIDEVVFGHFKKKQTKA